MIDRLVELIHPSINVNTVCLMFVKCSNLRYTSSRLSQSTQTIALVFKIFRLDLENKLQNQFDLVLNEHTIYQTSFN